MRYHEFCAMNTMVLLVAEGQPHRLQEGFRAVEDLVRRYEKRFTRFSEESEISALNRSAGGWYWASAELYELVSLAYQCYQLTDGLYNPGGWAAVEHSKKNRRSQWAEYEARTNDFNQTRFEPLEKAIYLPYGLQIDLDRIVKGWIAERAARLLELYAYACVVDAGGDLFACGFPENGRAWTVAIEDPFETSKDVTTLSVGPGAVATASSGRGHRLKNRGMGSIYDPRTGLPVEAFWVSVTVTGDHAAQAEALATALLIGGPDAASQLTRRSPGTSYLAVDRNRRIWGSKGSQKSLIESETMAVR